jgi:transcriptional antiterminator
MCPHHETVIIREIKRVLHVTRRVILRYIEVIKIVLDEFSLGTLSKRKPNLGKNTVNFGYHG